MFHKLLPILLLSAGIFALASARFNQPSVANHSTREPKGSSRMYRSDDMGHTWSPIGEGLPDDLQVTSLDTLGKLIVLASSNHGVYLSDPQKRSWRQLDTFLLPSLNISSLHVANGVIFIVVSGKYIYATSDLGRIWMPLNHNLYNEEVMPILRAGDELLVGTDSGIFTMNDGTNTWRKTFKGRVTSLLSVGNSFLARTPWGLFSSSDHGDTWGEFGADLKPGDLMVMDGKIIARTGYLWDMSEDMGKTWNPLKTGTSPENGMYDMVKAGDSLISCLEDGIYQSCDWGKQWNAVYHFPTVEPKRTFVELNEQGDATLKGPFIDLIVVDGVIYGGFGWLEGC